MSENPAALANYIVRIVMKYQLQDYSLNSTHSESGIHALRQQETTAS